jgi:hypothetical protein
MLRSSLEPIELADTSVWARLGNPDSSGSRLPSRMVGSGCDQVAMEVLFSARDAKDFEATEEALSIAPGIPSRRPTGRRLGASFVSSPAGARCTTDR